MKAGPCQPCGSTIAERPATAGSPLPSTGFTPSAVHSATGRRLAMLARRQSKPSGNRTSMATGSPTRQPARLR